MKRVESRELKVESGGAGRVARGVALAMAMAMSVAAAADPSLPPGYRSTPLAVPGFATGSVCADPADPNVFYACTTSTFAFFGDIDIVKVTLADSGGTLTATYQTVASGTTRTSGSGDGDDVLDNHFGAPGICRRTDGTMLVADSSYGTDSMLPGVIGETNIVLTDLNGDGDFRDIVAGIAEAAEYAAPVATNAGDYSGAELAADGATGAAFVATADGGTNGEILRIGAGGAPVTVFADGLAYGAGVDFVGTDVVFGAADNFPASNGSVVRARDLNADNDALDASEQTVLTTTIDPVFDVATGPDGVIYATTNNTVAATHRFHIERVDATTGAITTFADFPEGGFQFMQGLAFSSGPGTFAPSSGLGTKRLAVIDSTNGLNIIEPIAPIAGVRAWETYQ